MTFTDIRGAVCDYCNLTSPEALARVGKAINRHYRRVTSSLGLDAARFVTRSVSTTNGVRTVVFTEIEKIDRLLDTTSATDIRLLQERSVHDLRSTQPGQGQPDHWAFQNSDADSVTVLLDTVPQTVYSLQADGWVTLADLSGTDEPVFPESYHDILVWFVISEELLKKEKDKLAGAYQAKAAALLSELRFFLADSHTHSTVQGAQHAPIAASGASGGGAGNTGATAYTQTALLTFDRGAGIVPFAVAEADAPYVPNLGAEFLGNVTSDRLIGRDAVGTGESEQLTVSNGLEFTGAGGIGIANLGVTTARINDLAVTTAKLAALAVTTAKIDDLAVTDAKVSTSAAIAASKVLGTMPVGAILPYGGASAPALWLLCNGASLLRASYPALFTAIGTAYGTADGTHFTLPDLRQRMPLGKAASGTGATLGDTGGAIDHTHTGPSHTHTGPAHTHDISLQSVAVQSGTGTNINNPLSATTTSSGTGATGASGTGATSANNPPYQVVNFIIFANI